MLLALEVDCRLGQIHILTFKQICANIYDIGGYYTIISGDL